MDTPIGFIVSWQVPAVVSLDKLRTGLKNAGLDIDMAPDLRPPSLVARSASLIAKNTSDKASRKLARPVTHMSRQITSEVVGDDASLSYAKEATIGYDDVTGRLVSDGGTSTVALTETALYIRSTRTAGDVTRIVQRIVEASGSDLIPVRHQGGAYFIPQGHEIIDRIDTVLKAIEGELSRFACTLGHGTSESVSMTVTDYLVTQIDEFQESIDQLNEKGIRSDVKNRRLTRVAALKDKIHAYAGLITTGTEKLNELLASAEASLLAKLGPQEDEEELAAAPVAEADAAPVLDLMDALKTSLAGV